MDSFLNYVTLNQMKLTPVHAGIFKTKKMLQTGLKGEKLKGEMSATVTYF